MRERSAEEQPPKLKTYSLEMTLIKLFRNYTMSSSCSLCLRHPLPAMLPFRVAVLFNISDRLHLLSPQLAPEEEVMADNPFEIPQAMRDQAEQNMKQALPRMSSSQIS